MTDSFLHANFKLGLYFLFSVPFTVPSVIRIGIINNISDAEAQTLLSLYKSLINKN